ncbi:Mam33 family protein [Schizosaccharomyces cryophilus OY26]|uniref:Mam33 family protein n=1 Tax=Schizosaccharomyces cryophilus (strain OY26 / ATCC MYA-4695 / CBS 11777 / NBRC 106824 / NRRL Y48691) TaxID=653667 RepID=S9XJZ8_SCHCR|nr:Mam33 family protein [Schizosaccharomyces cryophilus OY26]EPY54026.1 Mam33 family protein [Schizosaccharomyces cryophilus OY26]
MSFVKAFPRFRVATQAISKQFSTYRFAASPRVARLQRSQIIARAPFGIRMASHDSRKDLLAALESELDYEKKHVLTDTSLPPIPYEIEDIRGDATVKLKTQKGDETIYIKFNVSDDTQEPAMEENELSDFQEEYENKGQNQPIQEIPEDEVGTSEALGRFQPCTVEVLKPGAGVLAFEAMAYDEGFEIENIFFSKDTDVLTSDSVEAEWTRRKQYLGPSFKELDPELQDLFHSFLEERHIDSETASFVISFGLTKELKEYVRWLENVRDFVK